MKDTLAAGLILTVVVVIAGVIVLERDSATAAIAPATQEEELSLITETPEEGFALALELSRKGVTETQPDPEVLHTLRPDYAHDAQSLISVSHVAAVHFQTVAAANNYWRD